jgi:hypothetical protein
LPTLHYPQYGSQECVPSSVGCKKFPSRFAADGHERQSAHTSSDRADAAGYRKHDPRYIAGAHGSDSPRGTVVWACSGSRRSSSRMGCEREHRLLRFRGGPAGCTLTVRLLLRSPKSIDKMPVVFYSKAAHPRRSRTR